MQRDDSMMPKPTLSFTIPSLKDESLLDCRVYIPESLLDVATPSRSAASSASEDDAQPARRSNGATQNGHADKAPNVSGHTKRKKAAIIAHPYAPLGGSFDDYIVQEIGGILLEEGFVVGLFNFRGAGNSKGRTSWSAKPEVGDYISFVGFMAVFMHYLNLHISRPTSSTAPISDLDIFELSTIPSQTSTNPTSPSPISPTKRSRSTTDFGSAAPSDQKESDSPLLLLAGYSYGSLITILLPPLSALLTPFTQPILGSTACEIRLRAQHLAETQNHLHYLRLSRASDARRNLAARRLSGIRVGGEELPADVRRSVDGNGHHRSFGLDRLERTEWARKSVERVRSLRRSIDGTQLGSLSPSRTARHVSHGQASQADREKESPRSSSGEDAAGGKAIVPSKDEAEELGDPGMRGKSRTGPNALMPPLVYSFAVSYLLISPIQGLLGGLATMFSTTPASAILPSLAHFAHRKGSGVGAPTEGEKKLVENRTLAVFGSRDGFSNVERMRRWIQHLKTMQGNRLTAIEVRDGGHFWHSQRELEALKEGVRGWVEDLEWL